MEKTFIFEFTEQEANLVLNALAELPFKTVNGLIKKLIEVAQKQQTEVTQVAE